MKNSQAVVFHSIGGDLSSDNPEQKAAKWALQYEPGSDKVTLNIQGIADSDLAHDKEESAKGIINKEGVDDLIHWLMQVRAAMGKT